MVVRTVDAVLAAGADPVLVVTGHESEHIRAALAGRPVRFVHNAEYAAGLSGSLRAALAALPEDAEGALVCLGDMPLVTAAHLARLVAAFRAEDRPRHLRSDPCRQARQPVALAPALLRGNAAGLGAMRGRAACSARTPKRSSEVEMPGPRRAGRYRHPRGAGSGPGRPSIRRWRAYSG